MKLLSTVLAAFLLTLSLQAQEADWVFTNGRILTADETDAVVEALAIRGDTLLMVGTNEAVLAARGPATQVMDLKGKTVIPGLIDSHTHPSGASMIEFDHPIPDMETVQDVLGYVRSRADVLEDGEWIHVRQVFITRLKEQRYPTRAELDAAAPANPVIFSTGPDASLNSQALKLTGVDRDFQVRGQGKVERDPQTGEPTGILRAYRNLIDVPESTGERRPSEAERYDRLLQLVRDYNANGITSIGDRNADASAVERFQALLDRGDLTVRVALSRNIPTNDELPAVQQMIREVARHPLVKGGPMLRIIGIKTFLDGGMLTGSAYMREPWGVSRIYSIDDPQYRGVLLIPEEKLLPIVRTTVESGLQFTAHSVGDGAVHLLLDTYDEISRSLPLRPTRPCITHSNFMSAEAIETMSRLGVVADIQPAWLYLDTHTLAAQFGYDRLRFFQPLRSLFEAGVIAGGGSDHMQKIGSLRSINPYNPFLGMWVAVTRQARDYEGPLHPAESLTRLQALRFYTANNAYLLFQEERTGSLEPGKLADFAILDRDFLDCPVDELKDTQVLETWLGGKRVFARNLE